MQNALQCCTEGVRQGHQSLIFQRNLSLGWDATRFLGDSKTNMDLNVASRQAELCCRTLTLVLSVAGITLHKFAFKEYVVMSNKDSAKNAENGTSGN